MLLRNCKKIGNRLWLENEDVTFQDPSIFRRTMIATQVCSTHSLKSNKNKLNTKSSTFLDTNNTPFDFKPIINTHERDTEITCKIIKLNLVSVFLDLWNKMNVLPAKISFTYEIITEIFCNFVEHVQCKNYVKLNGTFDERKEKK